MIWRGGRIAPYLEHPFKNEEILLERRASIRQMTRDAKSPHLGSLAHFLVAQGSDDAEHLFVRNEPAAML